MDGGIAIFLLFLVVVLALVLVFVRGALRGGADAPDPQDDDHRPERG